MGIAAMCVSIIGFILATYGMFTCRFLQWRLDHDYHEIYGLFGYINQSDECVSYTDYDKEQFSGAFKFSHAMDILATILGSLALVGTLSLSCMSMPNLILKSVFVLYLISFLCVKVVN